jgi:hypothetical protein
VHFTSLERFRRRFCYSKWWFCYSEMILSFFYLFRLNLWKIIVNHRKIIKWKIQFCCTPHE